jgi:hypothetical protein
MYDLSWNKITIIVSDSVNYMMASINNIKQTFAPHLIHIICNAHLCNLIANIIREHPFFDDINELFTSVQYQFSHGNKKGKYLSQLEESGRPVKAFPKISLIKWNS